MFISYHSETSIIIQGAIKILPYAQHGLIDRVVSNFIRSILRDLFEKETIWLVKHFTDDFKKSVINIVSQYLFCLSLIHGCILVKDHMKGKLWSIIQVNISFVFSL